MTITNTSIEITLLEELEARIITGQIKPGDFLPAERTLATQMEVSRPVIHNVLIRLQEKGFIDIIPRQGAKVLDYKTSGKLDMVNSLINCYGRDLDHYMRDSVINLLKGHTDMIIADISNSEYKAKLELSKEVLSSAMQSTDKIEKIECFINLYKRLAQAAVNPFYLMFINSCDCAFRDIAVELVERDSAYHTMLRLFTSLLHQLKIGNTEKAYALNQTIFELIFDIWR